MGVEITGLPPSRPFGRKMEPLSVGGSERFLPALYARQASSGVESLDEAARPRAMRGAGRGATS